MSANNIDLSQLSPEERKQLDTIMDKATVTSGSTAPPAETPPPRRFGDAPNPNPATVTRLLSPSEWVAKQISTLEAVGEQNYRDGVRRPKKDPIKAAIEAQPAYINAMKDPKVLQRRVDKLKKTNIDEWVQVAETLGASKLVEGVKARQFKVERFVAGFQPKLLSHLAKIDVLPSGTDAEREKRMIENLRGLKALKGV